MVKESTLTDILKRVHIFGIASALFLTLPIGAMAQLTGSIGGLKWCDANGDAQRDSGEPGLAGVTIYSDLNFDGHLDDDEPRTISDETGQYWFVGLTPGTYIIREVVPDGFVQTFPLHPTSADEAYYEVSLNAGDNIGDIDFGNDLFAGCTVVIDGCDSGVVNDLVVSSSTIADLVAECADGANNHGEFVSCIAHLTSDLTRAGIITGREEGVIQRCAAQALIP